MTLPDRLDEIAWKLLATKDYSTFAHAIYQAAIELRSVQDDAAAMELVKQHNLHIDQRPDKQISVQDHTLELMVCQDARKEPLDLNAAIVKCVAQIEKRDSRICERDQS